ncbi:hypothetical protein DID77_01895 [Candidatus Marinamargulisbacteria bacterium SCGC AG-439-L15]|nr:hypothetical protein DID77_01895 [Candidatus Marinamargulisbacteria bacterium SCGC AG-439-L15]
MSKKDRNGIKHMRNQFNLILLCLLLVPAILTAQSRYVETHKKELSNIKKELQKNKKIISQKKEKEKNISTQLGALKRNIRVESKRLKKTNQTLTYYQRQLQQTKQTLAQLNKEREVQLGYLSNRLQTVYKNQYPGIIEFVFAPKNYQDVLSQKYFFEKVMKSDLALIDTIRKQEAAYQTQKQTLNHQKNNISKLKTYIIKKKNRLSSKSKQTTQTLNKLRREIKIFEKRNALLKRDSEDIRKLIQNSRVGKKVYYAVGKFIKPSKGWISSRFGYRKHPIFKRRILHRGIDIAAPRGYQIRAANHGHILFSGWQKGYGNVTIINHGWKDGHKYSTVYAHQSRMVVKKGQYIKKGQLIGYVGSTGYSTGPHLHFELRRNGKPINPTRYVSFL